MAPLCQPWAFVSSFQTHQLSHSPWRGPSAKIAWTFTHLRGVDVFVPMLDVSVTLNLAGGWLYELFLVGQVHALELAEIGGTWFECCCDKLLELHTIFSLKGDHVLAR